MPLPGSILPRRADTTAVVGHTLTASTSGIRHRRITTQLKRPMSTVARWVQSVPGDHTTLLHTREIRWTHAIDPKVLNQAITQHNRLGDALTALTAAVTAVHNRLGLAGIPTWTLIGRFTDSQPDPAHHTLRPKTNPSRPPHAHARPPPRRPQHPTRILSSGQHAKFP